MKQPEKQGARVWECRREREREALVGDQCPV